MPSETLPIEDARARTGASLGLFPLATLALTFFVPSVRACDHAESGVLFVRDAPRSLPVVLFPYLAAAVLCVLTALAVRGKNLQRAGIRAASYATLFLAFASDVATLVAVLFDRTMRWLLAAWCVGTIAGGVLVFVRALRASGVWRWILVLASFDVFLLAHPLTMLFAMTWYLTPEDLLGGGDLYLGAIVVLAAIVGWTLAGAPRPKRSP